MKPFGEPMGNAFGIDSLMDLNQTYEHLADELYEVIYDRLYWRLTDRLCAMLGDDLEIRLFPDEYPLRFSR